MQKTRIFLDNIPIDVTFKKIKNIHLRVKSPDGQVVISAPRQLNVNDVQAFATSKKDWIRKSQKKIQSVKRQSPKLFRDGETHYLWGRACILHIIEKNDTPSVIAVPGRMDLTVPPGADTDLKMTVMEAWYRDQLRNEALPLIKEWERIMQVRINQLFIRRMKTRWGTCNVRKGTIRLNTELAARPLQCLEYIVVHEMTHLLESSHNARFKELMDKFLPQWRQHHDTLRNLPGEH